MNHSGKLSVERLRENAGVKVTEVSVGDITLKLAVVSGLANARRLLDKVRNGEEHYDLIEVMACCGGCINGGGQPVNEDKHANEERSKGLYDNDRMLQFHSSQENPYLQKIYNEDLDPHKAHALFHTEYNNRKRIEKEDISLNKATAGESKLEMDRRRIRRRIYELEEEIEKLTAQRALRNQN